MVYAVTVFCVLSYALVGGFFVWLLAGVPRCDRPWYLCAWFVFLWLLSPFLVAFAGTATVLSLAADRLFSRGAFRLRKGGE